MQKLRIAPACYHVLHLIPIMAAHEMNYFYDEGLHDEDGRRSYEIVRDGLAPFMFEQETLAQRMKEQSIDIAMDVKPSTVAYLQQKGHDLYIVAGWRNQQSGYIIARPEIKTLPELRGKRIGVIDLTDVLVTVAAPWLKRAGVDPDNGVVWVTGVYPRSAPGELLAGTVDAGFVDRPDSAPLLEQGYNIVLDIKDHYPNGRPDRIIAATGQALEQKPELVKACLRGMVRAYWYMRRQPETFEQVSNLERRLRQESPCLSEHRTLLTCFSPAHMEECLPFPYDGLPTGLADYLQEAIELGKIEDYDLEKMCSLGLMREGFAELAGRPELQPQLERIKSLVARLGY